MEEITEKHFFDVMAASQNSHMDFSIVVTQVVKPA